LKVVGLIIFPAITVIFNRYFKKIFLALSWRHESGSKAHPMQKQEWELCDFCKKSWLTFYKFIFRLVIWHFVVDYKTANNLLE
jgi:hypothetical protein